MKLDRLLVSGLGALYMAFSLLLYGAMHEIDIEPGDAAQTPPGNRTGPSKSAMEPQGFRKPI
jgi:hypothetical protein